MSDDVTQVQEEVTDTLPKFCSRRGCEVHVDLTRWGYGTLVLRELSSRARQRLGQEMKKALGDQYDDDVGVLNDKATLEGLDILRAHSFSWMFASGDSDVFHVGSTDGEDARRAALREAFMELPTSVVMAVDQAIIATGSGDPLARWRRTDRSAAAPEGSSSASKPTKPSPMEPPTDPSNN